VNDINTTTRADSSRSTGAAVRVRRRQPRPGTYGYYEVNDRRTTNKAGSDIHSLYVQDQWTVGSRLTLNLGLRTEDEKVPSFRPEYLETAIHFDMGQKLAPRLGAAYDLFGDGKMKVFGSWGMYYDWTKYELPRGSFGAETWCIYYRGLDTTQPRQPQPDQHAGSGPVDDPGQLPRPPRAVVCRQHRPGHPADASVELQRGHGVSAQSQLRVHGELHPQRPAPDHRRPRRAGCAGQRDLRHRQPG
jgi:hypothetical protein